MAGWRDQRRSPIRFYGPRWQKTVAQLRKNAAIALLVGLAIVIGLVIWQGVATVAAAFAAAGIAIVLLAPVYLPHLILGTVSWRLLFAPGRAPRFGAALFAKWIGGSINWLLPVANVGGELVRARLVSRHDVRGTDAGASVIVDKTVQALSALLWVMIGLVLLISLSADVALMAAVGVGLALFGLGIFGFLVVQRAGMFGFVAGRLARLSGSSFWERLSDQADEMDATIRATYANTGRIALAIALRLASRLVLAGEVWLAAYLMGYPIGLVEAVMLKSLTAAARSGAFVIPGGLGAQEAAYMAFGALIGQPPELMLSVSLATRLRELLIGVPGLIAWQYAEGQSAMITNETSRATDPGRPEQSA